MTLEARIAEIVRQGSRDEQMRGLCGLGAELFAEEDLDGALTCFDRAIGVSPESARAWVGRGSVLARRGRNGEALGCIARALDVRPGLLSALVLKADILLKSGARDEALECLDQAVRANDDDVFLRLGRARLLEEMDCFADAALDYERALALAGEDADGWHRLATARAKARDDAGAQEALAKFVVLASADDPRLDAAKSMIGQLERYSRKAAPTPTPPRAPKVTVTETTELRSSRRPSEKPRTASNVSMRPTKPDPIAALRIEADAALGAQRFHEALEIAERAYAVAPNDPVVHRLRGDCLVAVGRLLEGVYAYERAAQQMRTDPDLWLTLGRALKRLKQDVAAREALERALALGAEEARSLL